ncbi:MAG: hypothetical protein GY913_16015 [Proteobacteria bacterium]|nr:hypothetical protein [Pseudomonadota bacterium]MCP4918411.1 hypothetical protein [Pseudomonadota bacterium]
MVTIKKYSNRRLYDTSKSRYLNLEELAALVRSGETVRVVDAKSGEDLTREVLMEVVLKTLKGAELLPVGMLHRMIRSTGTDPVQRMLHDQLSTGMQLVSAQMDQVEAMLGRGPKPSEAQAPQSAPHQAGDEPPVDEAPEGDPELEALRAKLAALEARLKG